MYLTTGRHSLVYSQPIKPYESSLQRADHEVRNTRRRSMKDGQRAEQLSSIPGLAFELCKQKLSIIQCLVLVLDTDRRLHCRSLALHLAIVTSLLWTGSSFLLLHSDLERFISGSADGVRAERFSLGQPSDHFTSFSRFRNSAVVDSSSIFTSGHPSFHLQNKPSEMSLPTAARS